MRSIRLSSKATRHSLKASLLLAALLLLAPATMAAPEGAADTPPPVTAPEPGTTVPPSAPPSQSEEATPDKAAPAEEAPKTEQAAPAGDPVSAPTPDVNSDIENLFAPDMPQKKKDKPADAPEPPKNTNPILYITDTDNGRIVVMQGIEGEGFTSVGLPGYGLGRFLRPAQIWLDYAARLYIADSGNNRVVRIDQSKEPGWTEVDGLSEPHGVAVDGTGVYVSDTKADRVVVYEELENKQPIREVLSHPQLKRPTDLWIDKEGALYICCGEDPPGGKLLKTWMEKGLAESNGAEVKPRRRWAVFAGEGLSGSRFLPSSVVTDKSGVTMLDVSGQRLVTMQDITGKRLKEEKFRVDPRYRLSRPMGMAVDKTGRRYIADSGNDRILELSADGSVVGEFQLHQDDPGTLLSNPSSIFIFSPAPPPPPKDEKDDKKSKGKGKGKLKPKKPDDKKGDVEINTDW